jgi:hypothetical protein
VQAVRISYFDDGAGFFVNEHAWCQEFDCFLNEPCANKSFRWAAKVNKYTAVRSHITLATVVDFCCANDKEYASVV